MAGDRRALLRMIETYRNCGRVKTKSVVPAHAGTYNRIATCDPAWVPACAGTTMCWFAAIYFLTICVPTTAAEWKPEKPVEIVVNTPPGNGPDRTARVMLGILQDKKQIDVPVAIVNKLGGGGVVAYTYLNSRPGDGHTLMIASKALLTNHIAGRGPSYGEFTPVAHLFAE